MRKFKRLPKLIGQRKPVKFVCPSCNRAGTTVTSNDVTGKQVCWSLGLCLFCCCTCSCLLPLCSCFYNVKHSCPKCLY